MLTEDTKHFIRETVKFEVAEAVKKALKQKGDPRKHSFQHSQYYDKVKFAEGLKGWSKAKLRHYYEAAMLHSESKGAKYCNWVAAVKNWDKMKPFDEPAPKPEYVPPDTSDAASPAEIREALKKLKPVAQNRSMDKFITENKKLKQRLMP